MYCRKCGKKLPDSANFCPYCGADVYKGEDINESSRSLERNSEFCAFERNESYDKFQKNYKLKLSLYNIVRMISGILLLASAALPIESYSSDGLVTSNSYFINGRGEVSVFTIALGLILVSLAIGIIVSSAFQVNKRAIYFSIGGIIFSFFMFIISLWWHADDGISVGVGIYVSITAAAIAIFTSVKIYRMHFGFTRVFEYIHVRYGVLSLLGVVLLLASVTLPIEKVSGYIFFELYSFFSLSNVASFLYVLVLIALAIGILRAILFQKKFLVIAFSVIEMLFTLMELLGLVYLMGQGEIIGIEPGAVLGLVGSVLSLLGGVLMR